MDYLVVYKWMNYQGQWKTAEHEFADYDTANAYAQEIYKDSVDEECVVLIYELKKSYN